jgi:hypothetical protein
MAERNADFRVMENHYYECIYDVINSNDTHEEKLQKLKRYKALIVRLNARRTERTTLD